MIRTVPFLAVASLALAAPVAAADNNVADAAGAAELAKILDGRVAGEPVDCIRDSSSSALEIVGGTALVFKRGPTIYVNQPDGANTLDRWDVPVFYKFGGSDLCKLDRVELRQRGSQIPGPSLFLARFVPYTVPNP